MSDNDGQKVSPREHRDTGAAVERCREVGAKVAAYIRANQDAFQAEAALVGGGINERLHYRWLDGTDEACEAYQLQVLPALFDQAHAHEKRAEGDIGSSENGSSAWAGWHKWKLAARFRKLFGDVATTKVELTGKDGGPVKSEGKLDILTPDGKSKIMAGVLWGKGAAK